MIGQQLKEQGQQLALFNSGHAWLDGVLDSLEVWVRSKVGGFTLDDFRSHYEAAGGPPPASINAWGSVGKVAAKRGLIRATGGVRKAERPSAHARLVREWEAV